MNWRLFRILLRPSGGLQGEVRQPTTNDPLPGTINGQARLSETEVRSIISYAADRARTTRAGIRLPIGIHMEVFITVGGSMQITRALSSASRKCSRAYLVLWLT